MDTKEMEEVLQKSLALEEKGYEWYAEGAKKITNSLGKRMLERLAKDELNHMKRIKDIYESLTNNKMDEVQIAPPNFAVFEEIFNRMKEHMDEAVDDLTEVGVDDDEIINVALELEAHARFFYEEAAEKASDKTVQEFYELLAKEEKFHQELLQKTNQYLANPSLFFGMDGR
jgi:rubrerythrin